MLTFSTVYRQLFGLSTDIEAHRLLFRIICISFDHGSKLMAIDLCMYEILQIVLFRYTGLLNPIGHHIRESEKRV